LARLPRADARDELGIAFLESDAHHELPSTRESAREQDVVLQVNVLMK
jgi:hypothetical protein